MAYKLKLGEALDTGVRRIALQQLDRASETLATMDAARWVHETRKSLKRVRALLRLARGGIDKAVWRGLNAELRDIGRLLAGHRDQDVRRETIARLVETADLPLAAALERLAGIETDAASAVQQPNASPRQMLAAFAAANDRLLLVRAALARLDMDIGPRTLETGLCRTHRLGRKTLETCRAAPDSDAFHELRKAVQLHWRQMQVLGPAWPDLFKARVDSARALAQCLGLEHDFAVLAQWLDNCLDAATAKAAQRRDVRLVVAACHKAQGALRETALREADLLFAGRPRVFASETVSYWSAAVTAGTSDGPAASKAARRSMQRSPEPTTPMAERHQAAVVDRGRANVKKGSTRQRRAADGSGGARLVRAKRRPKARPAPAGST